MAKVAALEDVQVIVAPEATRATVGDTIFEFRPGGNVTIYSDTLTDADIRKEPAAAADTATSAAFQQISIGDDFIAKDGAKVEFDQQGGFVIKTDGNIQIKPAPLQIGQQTLEGIYAGYTADYKHQIFVAPEDLRIKGSFNQLAEAIKKFNDEGKFGHRDWEIGSVDVVQTVRKNLAEKGALMGSFRKFLQRDRYKPQNLFPRLGYVAVTSTEDKLYKDQVATVRFTEEPGQRAGAVRFEAKDARTFAARPVRLKPV
jgi:hypothetical protein